MVEAYRPRELTGLKAAFAASLLALAAACASTPPPAPPAPGPAAPQTIPPTTPPAPAPAAPTAPPAPTPTPPTVTPPPVAQVPASPTMTLVATTFAEVPGWSTTDAVPALAAFKRSCAVLRNRPQDGPVGARARYGGTAGNWASACQEAATITDANARSFFERRFTPLSVSSAGGEAKLTSYYEPVFQARSTPEPGFNWPIRPRPNDLLRIDLDQFARAIPLEPDRAPVGTWWGRVEGDRIVPYPDRGAIMDGPPNEVIGWAHPADVYDLQVQGSGRIVFPDGRQVRAAYAAQNGRKWNSIYRALRNEGLLTAGELNAAGVRAWIDRTDPATVQRIFRTDPSYVFFQGEPIPDPSIGPRGAQGVPLTGLGSVAVDPAYHPYGAVVFVEGSYPDANGAMAPFRRLLVAQDTGGAIRRGPLRGDVFWGTGADAGRSAGRMNAPARWWTLVPNEAVSASLGERGPAPVTTAGR
jgi:membrane-bound lytic murein transglycosylase A